MSSVSIFQNYYLPEQKADLERCFLPYDGTKNHPLHYEMGPIVELYETGQYKKSDYVGLFSHKFKKKAKITGDRFLDFVERCPGYDVYFINPLPQKSYFHFNVWEQGEACHPGISALTQELFAWLGYTVDVSQIGRHDQKNLLYCNYWIGNEKFWDSYMSFLYPLFDYATRQSSSELHERLFSPTHYHRPAPMFPFIFERLFSTFLSIHPEIRVIGYRHSVAEIEQCCLTDLEAYIIRTMRDVVDQWDLECEYSQERRQIFKALGQAVQKYDELFFSIEGHPYET